MDFISNNGEWDLGENGDVIQKSGSPVLSESFQVECENRLESPQAHVTPDVAVTEALEQEQPKPQKRKRVEKENGTKGAPKKDASSRKPNFQRAPRKPRKQAPRQKRQREVPQRRENPQWRVICPSCRSIFTYSPVDDDISTSGIQCNECGDTIPLSFTSDACPQCYKQVAFSQSFLSVENVKIKCKGCNTLFEPSRVLHLLVTGGRDLVNDYVFNAACCAHYDLAINNGVSVYHVFTACAVSNLQEYEGKLGSEEGLQGEPSGRSVSSGVVPDISNANPAKLLKFISGERGSEVDEKVTFQPTCYDGLVCRFFGHGSPLGGFYLGENLLSPPFFDYILSLKFKWCLIDLSFSHSRALVEKLEIPLPKNVVIFSPSDGPLFHDNSFKPPSNNYPSTYPFATLIRTCMDPVLSVNDFANSLKPCYAIQQTNFPGTCPGSPQSYYHEADLDDSKSNGPSLGWKILDGGDPAGLEVISTLDAEDPRFHMRNLLGFVKPSAGWLSTVLCSNNSINTTNSDNNNIDCMSRVDSLKKLHPMALCPDFLMESIDRTTIGDLTQRSLEELSEIHWNATSASSEVEMRHWRARFEFSILERSFFKYLLQSLLDSYSEGPSFLHSNHVTNFSSFNHGNNINPNLFNFDWKMFHKNLSLVHRMTNGGYGHPVHYSELDHLIEQSVWLGIPFKQLEVHLAQGMNPSLRYAHPSTISQHPFHYQNQHTSPLNRPFHLSSPSNALNNLWSELEFHSMVGQTDLEKKYFDALLRSMKASLEWSNILLEVTFDRLHQQVPFGIRTYTKELKALNDIVQRGIFFFSHQGYSDTSDKRIVETVLDKGFTAQQFATALIEVESDLYQRRLTNYESRTKWTS